MHRALQRSICCDQRFHGDCIGAYGTARSLSASKLIDQPKDNIEIYPNPAKGFINIDLGENKNQTKSIELVDLSGKKLTLESVNGRRKISIAISRFTPGMYMIRMNGNKTVSQKVMIQ